MMEPEAGVKIGIHEIDVGERHRIDFGDISKLKESIREHGLLQPIVITPDKHLVAGGRRLMAVKELDWVRVPVHVVHYLDDAAARLRAEREENTCRKDMTVSELVAIGKRLEELERPKAQERQMAGRKLGGEVFAGREALPTPDGKASKRANSTAHFIGQALGVSDRHYERARQVVDAMNDPDPTVAEVAKEAAKEMDETGRVEPAYNKVRDARKPLNGKPKASPKHGPRRKHLHVIESITTALFGLATAAEEITALDGSVTSEEATRLSGDLSQSLASLRRLNSLLNKEITK